MAGIVCSYERPSVPSRFNKMGYEVTLLALDYLDSLIPISSTCKYLSSRNSEFWKGFCYKFRVTTMMTLRSDYFFYAEYILMRKSNISMISQMLVVQPFYKSLLYPIEDILKIIRLTPFISTERILNRIVRELRRNEIYSQMGNVDIGTRPMDAIVAKIGTLFTFFLGKGAWMNERVILDIVKFNNGLIMLKVIQQLFRRRNFKIPSVYFLNTYKHCSSQQLREYCFDQLPRKNKTLDMALTFRVSCDFFYHLVIQGYQIFENTLETFIVKYSNTIKHWRELDNFILVLRALIKRGGKLTKLLACIFKMNVRVVGVLDVLLQGAISDFKGEDYLSVLIDIINQGQFSYIQVESVLINFLIKHGSKVTMQLLKKLSDHVLPWYVKEDLINAWNQQNLHSPSRIDDINILIEHLPLYRKKLTSLI